MAASDAIPVPRKNTAFRYSFAIRKPSDSTLITTWAGMDSEVSLDGAAFADCTNEATEIGTSGVGYIDLTAAEMNADTVVLKVTVTNTGSVPLVFTFNPESAGDYRVADTQKVDVETIKTNPVVNAGTITFPTTATLASTTNIAGFAAGAISEAAFATTDGSFHPLGIVDQGTAQSATSTSLVLRAGAAFADSQLIGATVLITGGTTGVGQTRRIIANTGSTDTVTVLDWTTTPTGTITYKIFRGTPVDVRRWLGTAAATPSVAGVPEVDITHVMGVSASVSGTIDANVVSLGGDAQSLTDLKDFADAGYDPATNKVQGVVLVDTTTTNTDMRGTDAAATAANLAVVAGYLDTEIAAIKAKTDTIPVNPASTTNITAATGCVLSAAGVRDIWEDDHTGVAFSAETAGWYLNDLHTDVNQLLTDWTNGGRLDLILDIIAADTTTDIPAMIDALPTAAENFTAVLTTALTESYAADGVAPTLAQAILLIQQALTEFTISGTTTTVKKLDGTTTAATLTLNDGTTPTGVTRAT